MPRSQRRIRSHEERGSPGIPSPAEDERLPRTAPSMLDLVRLSPRRLFPPGGRALYRHLSVLTDMGEGTEVLDVACGRGVTLEYLVQEHGVHGSGIEEDEALVELGQERVRELGLGRRLQLQASPVGNLPYRDEIFDVSVGELGMTANTDPETAVRELVRVTRSGGSVVLIQLVWKAPVEPRRRRILEDHLGVRPLMLVEWKRLLREAGVTQVHTEDWTDDQTAFRPTVAKPFPDFTELFSLVEKVGILRRAWQRWGWAGVRAVLARERAVHRLLTRERILGLDVLKGIRTDPSAALVPEAGEAPSEQEEEEGLPLFREPGQNP